MRFNLSLLPLALLAANGASATYILLEQVITAGIPVRTGVLVTDDGHVHNIGFIDSGCTTAGLGFVKEMCIDGGNKRAHIYWTNQPGKKYCFVRGASEHDSCGKWQFCSSWEYKEAPCTW